MNFKKTIAGISALSLLLSTSAVSAVTASAADEEKAYENGTMEVYYYAPDVIKSIDCRYYADKPNVPYIRLSDFYRLWADQEVEIKNNNDGTYEVKVPVGVKGIIDTDKDTVSTDDVKGFYDLEDIVNGEDSTNDLMIKAKPSEEEPIAVVYDFSNYNIDLIGEDSDIWYPAATLCDTFESDLKMASCFNGTMFFLNDLGSDFSRLALYDPVIIKASYDEYINGRPKDLVDYNYSEICFVIDHVYGYPGRIPLNDVLAEKGIDRLLSETNDQTRKIKEYLLSEDVNEYYAGFHLLNNIFWDGGHTAFGAITSYIEKEQAEVINSIEADFGEIEGGINWLADYTMQLNSGYFASVARGAMFDEADDIVQISKSLYTKKGDTAMFSFDRFTCDIDGWDKYYHENGDMPADSVSDFYTAVKMAAEDPEVKKFVIDLGSNEGGSAGALYYIMGIVADFKTAHNKDSVYNKFVDEEFVVDKNLDKAIDEKDDGFASDLKFGIIISKYSFSCANWVPSIARDNNILVMGEKSGGGACAIHVTNTPDGGFMSLSSGFTIIDNNKESVDNGIEPHYNLVKTNDDGTKDYSEVYDYEKISRRFDEFYNLTPAASSETTTTTAPETTTTAVTSTTVSDVTSAASETTVPASETTTAVTSSAETTALGTNDEISKMAARDYYVRTGREVTASEAKENKDGTLTIELRDENGKVVDTYTVDPVTGKGTDAEGNEVVLPQTGMNSLGTAAAAAGSVMLVLAGAAALYGSGILRKKNEDER